MTTPPISKITSTWFAVAAALAVLTLPGLSRAADGAPPPADITGYGGIVPGRFGMAPEFPTIDPVTGLPVVPTPQPFMDPEWKEPAKTLDEVVFDGLPAREAARHIREEFTNAFDIVIPTVWTDPHNPARSVNPGDVLVSLRLRNVTASEVFSAMNLLFDTENAPVRWELRMNGKRPVAVLRVVEWLVPQPNLAASAETMRTRKVFFVGNLITEKSGRRSIEELVQTITAVYKDNYGEPQGVLRFHKGAELLVVHGNAEQIDFVEQVISSLSR